MIRQIRTVVKCDPNEFDRDVNRSIEDGWKLSKRARISTPAGQKDYLYAELVKDDTAAQELKPAPITWQQAVETIKGICSGRDECCDDEDEGENLCPLFNYCVNLTAAWGVPADWPEVPHD